ncbi:DNA polymerase III subunit delta' C-terminal domain-containing protein [Buchnera aphidicola]|uniref:DNA polymerase III subunit delta' C-terminal domain-containing protein n=1 Tax=Buchnera aphidicola TaxID=9 RepID=UPI0030EC5A14
MSSYPWLDKIYKIIIQDYYKFNNCRSIIIKSAKNIGENQLIFSICKKILCLNSYKFNFCNICKSCLLIKNKNHPDLHILKKKKSSIGIDRTLKYIQKIIFTPKCSNFKILWVPEMNFLTESAISVFLKILENPPKNTWFFFNQNYSDFIKLTFKSRCFTYYIYPPNTKNSIDWFKKKKLNKKYNKEFLLSLKISENSPIQAKKFLNSSNFYKRKKFFKKIYLSIQKNNFITLISEFKKNKKKKIFWLCLIILDSIKSKLNKKIKLINFDQLSLIKLLKKKYSKKKLFLFIKYLNKTQFYIKNIKGIDKTFTILTILSILEKL